MAGTSQRQLGCCRCLRWPGKRCTCCTGSIAFPSAWSKLTTTCRDLSASLLVVLLPQSGIEIGGIGGQQALKELANFIRRIDNPWTPATPIEGYEIVRRRLFEPLNGRKKIAARAATVKAFQDGYSKNAADFRLVQQSAPLPT